MKIRIAIRLQVIGAANPRVGLNGRTAAGFVGRAGVLIPGRRAIDPIKGVIAAELVAHFVSHVIDVKGITNGIPKSGFARCLLAVDADDS